MPTRLQKVSTQSPHRHSTCWGLFVLGQRGRNRLTQECEKGVLTFAMFDRLHRETLDAQPGASKEVESWQVR
jgi:hypothetical protein